jgi:hypothetical protein
MSDMDRAQHLYLISALLKLSRNPISTMGNEIHMLKCGLLTIIQLA